MEYIESINIFGNEYKPNSCIILENAPGKNTPALIGMLALDTSSEEKDLYKCVAINGEEYEWRKLNSGSGNTSAEIVEDLNNVPMEERNEFTDYYVKSGSKYLHYRWSKELNDFIMIGTDAYSKNEVDNLMAPIKNQAESNATAIEGINEIVGVLQETIGSLDQRPRLTYEATYGTTGPNGETIELENYEVKDSTFILWETKGTDTRTAKSVLNIAGGGGGSGETSGNTLIISYQRDESGKSISRYTFTEDNNNNNESKIYYSFSGKTPDNEDVLYGEATWKLRRGTSGPWTTIAAETIVPTLEGELSSFNISQYVAIGSYQIMLTVTDESGGYATKTWAIQIIDLRLESTFDDTIAYPIAPVRFNYTPYGSVAKTIYFKLDGEKIGEVASSTSGILSNYQLPAQSHGAHLLEVYAEANINGAIVPTNHIFKDIIWYDSENELPVISCAQQSITMDQYDTVNIEYTVYDPSTEKPTVVIREGENVLATRVLSQSNTDLYTYNALDVFEGTEETHTHTLTLQCGNVEKQIIIVVEKIGINITPVEGNLAFDFNPIGYSNDSPNRLWEDSVNSNIRMTVSDDFDWINGGYRYDNNGDQYFCIKAGSSATISYKLFSEASLTKSKGKDFKFIFRTANVSNPKATFLSCVDKSDVGEITSGYYFEGNFYSEANKHDATHLIEPQVNNRYFDNYNERYYRYVKIEEKDENGNVIREYYAFTEDVSDIIGIEMKAHEAYIYDRESKYLYSPYSEDDIIEFEFNINKNTSDIPMIMGYEDGVATTPLVYGGSSSFNQKVEQNITLGSPYCDLWVYRLKVYERELSDIEILNNFIADARSPEEMISRYNRNQIFIKESTKLIPSSVAEACPWLRVIKIDTPYFTNDKDNRVKTNYIEQNYKNGTLPTDNWVAYHAAHSGQGTSSNNYGPAGRNLDLMLKITKDKETNAEINSEFKGITIKDAQGNETIVKKVPLTDNSIPVNYFNIKVNIASSENANNALLQKRYNDFNPYDRSFVRDNEEDKQKIKDTMEFYNCVVFLRESDETKNDQGKYVKHREFNDTEWHFYAIGNIGDSKKTDDTRLTDPTDPYECINEIIDVDVPLASFPSGEAAIALLEADNFDKKGSYEWRYIYEDDLPEGVTEAPEAYCKQKWIDFYKFVVNSTDEEFKRDLSNYFVVESALYYYLFTTRFTMVDNRAKNSFWHYGKTGEVDDNGEPVRKWDLSFDYDNDTSLGIDNDGDMVYRYGLEDTDVDENGIEVFRVSNSTFFRRIRDLFAEELANLYKSLSDQGAWSANDTITTFDAWQNQFPEGLWRLDIERKYLRTYTSSYIDGQPFKDALTRMAHGKKKYQRREFERNQEKYMASKYLSSPVLGDKLTIRCADTRTDNIDSTSKANYTINITPYSYMYLQAQYGNGNHIEPVRAEPGKTYSISPPEEKGFVDIIDIYGSEGLQSIGDISALYPKSIIASTAKKLKELKIGGKSIVNTNFEELSLGGKGSDSTEPLIETLNIENIRSTKFTSLDLSNLRKLKNLKASGAEIQSVEFANQGLLENAELPSVRALFMSSLKKLDKVIFDNNNYEELRNLFIEDSNIDNDKDGVDDLLKILPLATNLERVRITGINWELENTSILDVLYTKKGYGRVKTEEIPQSVLEGNIKVTGIYLQRNIEKYQAAWPNLSFDLSEGTEIPVYKVTFLNHDRTVLYENADFYVAAGDMAIDPVSQGYPMPEKEQDAQYKYEFKGWNSEFYEPVYSDKFFIAEYNSIIQQYKVKWMSENTEILSVNDINYGSSVNFEEELQKQEKTFEKTQLYQDVLTGAWISKVFLGWDKSTGFITKDTSASASNNFNEIIINAKWQQARTDNLPTELKDMTPAQIYLCSKRGLAEEKGFQEGDLIKLTLGHDYDFSNVRQEEIIALNNPKTFIREQETFDAPINTGVRLFDKDCPSFSMVIDYQFFLNNQGGQLVSCIDAETERTIFSLKCVGLSAYNIPIISINWKGSEARIGGGAHRDILVIKYTKEDSRLKVFCSSKHNVADNGIPLIDRKDAYVTVIEENKNVSFSDKGGYLSFGAPISTSYEGGVPPVATVSGAINWCKIWYEPLEEKLLEEMVYWPREEVTMMYCGEDHYKKSDNTAVLSFICKHLLGTRYCQMSPAYNADAPDGTGNIGGWRDSQMRQLLNTKIFNSFPYEWKEVLSKVVVKSLAGGGSDDVLSAEDYVYLPSFLEVDPSRVGQFSPNYLKEGKPINSFVAKEQRFRTFGAMPIYDSKINTTYNYSTMPENYNEKTKEGDIWFKTGSSIAYAYIKVSKETLEKNGKNSSYPTDDGGWILATEYWTRSPYYSLEATESNLRNYYWLVGQTCATNIMNASYSERYICPCFSI